MSDSPAKKKWLADNAVLVSFRLFKKNETDAAILEFYNGKPTVADIRKALTEYIANHPDD